MAFATHRVESSYREKLWQQIRVQSTDISRVQAMNKYGEKIPNGKKRDTVSAFCETIFFFTLLLSFLTFCKAQSKLRHAFVYPFVCRMYTVHCTHNAFFPFQHLLHTSYLMLYATLFERMHIAHLFFTPQKPLCI